MYLRIAELDIRLLLAVCLGHIYLAIRALLVDTRSVDTAINAHSAGSKVSHSVATGIVPVASLSSPFANACSCVSQPREASPAYGAPGRP